MKVTVEYFAQLRVAAECGSDEITCEDGATVDEVIDAACRRRAALRPLVLDADGSRHPWVLVSVDGRAVGPGASSTPADGALIVLSSPISGG